MSRKKQANIGLRDAEKKENKRRAKTLPNLFAKKEKLQALADREHSAAKSIMALTVELLPSIIKDFSGTIDAGALIEWFRDRLFGDGLTPDGR